MERRRRRASIKTFPEDGVCSEVFVVMSSFRCVCSGKLHTRHKTKNTFFPSFFRRACLLFIDDHCQVSEVMLHKSVFLLYPLSRSSGSFGLHMGTPREETPRYPTHAGLIMDIRHVGNRRFCLCLRFGGSGLKMKMLFNEVFLVLFQQQCIISVCEWTKRAFEGNSFWLCNNHWKYLYWFHESFINFSVAWDHHY